MKSLYGIIGFMFVAVNVGAMGLESDPWSMPPIKNWADYCEEEDCKKEQLHALAMSTQIAALQKAGDIRPVSPIPVRMVSPDMVPSMVLALEQQADVERTFQTMCNEVPLFEDWGDREDFYEYFPEYEKIGAPYISPTQAREMLEAKRAGRTALALGVSAGAASQGPEKKSGTAAKRRARKKLLEESRGREQK